MSDDNKGIYTIMIYLQHAQRPTQEASWPTLTFVAVCGFGKWIFHSTLSVSQLDLIVGLLKLTIALLKVRSSKWKIARNRLRIGRSRDQADRALYVVHASQISMHIYTRCTWAQKGWVRSWKYVRSCHIICLIENAEIIRSTKSSWYIHTGRKFEQRHSSVQSGGTHILYFMLFLSLVNNLS